MTEIERACVVLSMTGRDKGRLFVVAEVRGEYVFLVDGKLRKTQSPKKKNKKHVRLIRLNPEETGITDDLKKLSDSDIQKLLEQIRQNRAGNSDRAVRTDSVV